MVEAFIFDVDGTLADTERNGHRVAFNQAFEAFGLDWFWDEETYADLLTVTGGKERILHYVNNYNRKEKEREDLQDLIKKLHVSKTEKYVKLLNSNAIPLRTGVRQLLSQARERNIRLAIATTTTLQNVTALLKCTLGNDSVDWFEIIGAGDVVSDKKPAPDIYLFVLEKMGLSAADCIAFEDSYNGLQSSKGAHIKTIITYNAYTQHDDFDGASLVLDRLGDDHRPSEVLRQRFNENALSIDLINDLVK